jgi:cytochrome P450 family 144
VTIDFNDPTILLDSDVLEDPTVLHDALRREAPIWKIPGQSTFVVSEPKLIREAVGRSDDFSSNLVYVLHDDGEGRLIPFEIAPYRASVHVLSTADPPIHDHHRKILQPHLSPASVSRFAPAISQIVDEHLAPMLEERSIDAVAAFSDPVPVRTICEVVGLPASDASTVFGYANATGALLDGITDLDGMQRAATAGFELTIFVHERLEQALLEDPADRRGLLGVLSQAIEAGQISQREARDMLVVLVTAGSETTASLMATAIEIIGRDQDLQEALRRDPALIAPTLEEILRESGPFQFHYRFTPHDTILGGVEIPAGSQVLLMWAAANRPSPDSSIDERTPPREKAAPHFAFGRGLHFCIGAPVARLEARIAIERLLGATASFQLDATHPPTRRPSIFIRRHATLPIVVVPA